MSVEMKDSGIDWIGEIPKHWKVSAIKRNFQLYSGATPKTDNELYWNGGVAWITPADYKTEDRWIECGSRYISEEGFKSCAVTMLPKGSIIFSKRAPIGLVIMNSAPLCTNQGCIGCVPFNGNGDYYYYAMSICSEQFELLGSGTTFKEISATSFSNFILPTPTIEEQSRIANFLNKKCAEIDELIALQNQMIAKLTTYKQAVITETVTKGLDPNVKMKDSGVEWIGKIPEHWNVAKLKNLLTLKTGTTPKAYEDKNDSDKFINWYTPSDILENGNIISSSERNIAKRVLDEENISLYPSGSLMFVGIGALAGKVGYALEAGYSNQQITALIPKICNSKYYYYYLIADKNRIRDNAFFTTLPIINNGYLGQVIVLSPSIEEQQSIANYLDQKCKEIDELISIKKEKIEQLKTYKKSVIFEYVTGKKQAV